MSDDSEHIALCEAIVAELNRGNFSQLFTAERFFDAGAPFEDLDAVGLRVAVIPATRERTKLTRGRAYRIVYGCSVAIIAKIDPQDDDQKAAHLRLAEEIETYLCDEDHELYDYPDARFDGIGNEVIYSPEHLRDDHIFLAPFTANYRTSA